MKVEYLEADSQAFGRSVLSVVEFCRELDFAAFEQQYLQEYQPVYVSCKVPIENIADVHCLERHGFQVVECQIKSTIKLRKVFDTSRYPYVFERVTSEEHLRDVLAIAGVTFVHDRLTVDPLVGRSVSGERYRQYVLKSFRAEDEAVYRLYHPQTGQTLAFKTHKYLGNREALFLLGGVHPNYKTLGIGAANSYYEFNELLSKGIRKAYTHISAGNYPVFNLEISKLGFRVLATYLVLRKVYS